MGQLIWLYVFSWQLISTRKLCAKLTWLYPCSPLLKSYLKNFPFTYDSDIRINLLPLPLTKKGWSMTHSATISSCEGISGVKYRCTNDWVVLSSLANFLISINLKPCGASYLQKNKTVYCAGISTCINKILSRKICVNKLYRSEIFFSAEK